MPDQYKFNTSAAHILRFHAVLKELEEHDESHTADGSHAL